MTQTTVAIKDKRTHRHWRQTNDIKRWRHDTDYSCGERQKGQMNDTDDTKMTEVRVVGCTEEEQIVDIQMTKR